MWILRVTWITDETRGPITPADAPDKTKLPRGIQDNPAPCTRQRSALWHLLSHSQHPWGTCLATTTTVKKKKKTLMLVPRDWKLMLELPEYCQQEYDELICSRPRQDEIRSLRGEDPTHVYKVPPCMVFKVQERIIFVSQEFTRYDRGINHSWHPPPKKKYISKLHVNWQSWCQNFIRTHSWGCYKAAKRWAFLNKLHYLIYHTHFSWLLHTRFHSSSSYKRKHCSPASGQQLVSLPPLHPPVYIHSQKTLRQRHWNFPRPKRTKILFVETFLPSHTDDAL